MHRLHLKRNLRSLLFLLVTALVVTSGGALWWLNHTGLPSSWRAALEREIEKKGAHIRIGGLSWLPLRGLVASDVRLFADATMQSETARLGHILIDLDKTKLARGIIRLTRLEMRQADLSLPLDPSRPQSGTIEVRDVQGTLLAGSSKQIEIQHARGRLHDIEISLDAQLQLPMAKSGGSPESSSATRSDAGLQPTLDVIKSLQTVGTAPPKLDLQVVGDVGNPRMLRSTIRFNAESLARGGVILHDVSLDAVFEDGRLTVHSLQASDGQGMLRATADYDTTAGNGRFELSSTLDAPSVLAGWLGLAMPQEPRLEDGLEITAQGGFERNQETGLEIHATGHAESGPLVLRGIRFEGAETGFSLRGRNGFLRDTRLTHAQGVVQGKMLAQWPHIRIAAESDVPVGFYKALFKSDGMKRLVDDFQPRNDATFDLAIDGSFEAKVPDSWKAKGAARMAHTDFRGVALKSAECTFESAHDDLRFSDGKVVFDYRGYAMREAQGGPMEGTATVESVRSVRSAGTVELRNVGGAFWPAPVVRMFSKKVADSIEVYRFHRPPSIKASGVIGFGDTGKGKTDLDVDFRSEVAATYRFLDADVELGSPSGGVRIRDGRVNVDDLNASVLDGRISGKFRRDTSGMLAGDLSWNKLSQSRLQETWGMGAQQGGELSGRLDFTMMPGAIGTMDGKGNLLLEKTELFSVPVFGPLSPLISTVIGDRRAGFERAKTAWCSHTIRKGVMGIDEFHTETTSLFFTGDGSVDLGSRTIDMTLRMNARGLLGLLTLPIKPLYGLFQFRGTGPLRKPVWENVMFTTPPDSQMKQLNQPPKASKVLPES